MQKSSPFFDPTHKLFIRENIELLFSIKKCEFVRSIENHEISTWRNINIDELRSEGLVKEKSGSQRPLCSGAMAFKARGPIMFWRAIRDFCELFFVFFSTAAWKYLNGWCDVKRRIEEKKGYSVYPTAGLVVCLFKYYGEHFPMKNGEKKRSNGMHEWILQWLLVALRLIRTSNGKSTIFFFSLIIVLFSLQPLSVYENLFVWNKETGKIPLC